MIISKVAGLSTSVVIKCFVLIQGTLSALSPLNSPDMRVLPVVIVTRSSQRRVIAGHTLGVGFFIFYLFW